MFYYVNVLRTILNYQDLHDFLIKNYITDKFTILECQNVSPAQAKLNFYNLPYLFQGSMLLIITEVLFIFKIKFYHYHSECIFRGRYECHEIGTLE